MLECKREGEEPKWKHSKLERRAETSWRGVAVGKLLGAGYPAVSPCTQPLNLQYPLTIRYWAAPWAALSPSDGQGESIQCGQPSSGLVPSARLPGLALKWSWPQVLSMHTFKYGPTHWKSVDPRYLHWCIFHLNQGNVKVCNHLLQTHQVIFQLWALPGSNLKINVCASEN